MKKLTAGILASLIGLVSANSADAAVASTKYVEDRVEALDVAKIENANAEASYIKNIAEVDGKVTAETGALNEIALKGIAEGDAINFEEGANGATVVNADVRTVNNEENIVKVELKTDLATNKTYYEITAEKQTDNDTKYTEGNGVTISADNVISADIVQGANVEITTNEETGQMTISAIDTKYTEGDGISIADGVISADIVQGANVEITKDATTGQMTISATDTDTTLDNYTTTGDTGIQVLTRKLAADGVSYEYMWETIDRSYSETEPEQPAQQ